MKHGGGFFFQFYEIFVFSVLSRDLFQSLGKHILSEKPVDKRYLIIYFISKQFLSVYQKPA